MEKQMSQGADAAPKRIYVALVGSAPQATLDALLISLERFKNTISSDSAKAQFETILRTIQPSITAIDAFLDKVYGEKNPQLSIHMKGRTLIVEISMSESEFLRCIEDDHVNDILKGVTAVGSMPPQKLPNQKIRDYLSFPVKYLKDKFIKFS